MKEVHMSNKLFEEMAQSVIDGEPEIAVELAKKVLAEGLDPLQALNEGYIVGVNYVGKQFACGEMYLPELVGAGEAMKLAIAVLEPEMTRRGTSRTVLGKVVIGTVEGDIHDIGKSLVGTMLSSSGFQVYDLGVDVPIKTFVDKAREVDADIVGLSALLTTTMVKQRTVVKALQEAGLRPKVKVMIGGAPVTRGWAEEIGAEGFSEDAVGAVAVAKQIMGK
jgi:corrinoid protein of di/trimethylamine methyltransferase